ncbi:hypothetical protein [Kangiella geojedonensis]|nr:hypothetical protein [Kangiella geojedonensis]
MMVKIISAFIALTLGASLQSAQLRTVELEKQPTKLVLINSSSLETAGKGLKIKSQIQKELGVKLKLDNTLSSKKAKRYVADRAITPQEQTRLEKLFNAGDKKAVIFVVSGPVGQNKLDTSVQDKKRNNRNSKSLR